MSDDAALTRRGGAAGGGAAPWSTSAAWSPRRAPRRRRQPAVAAACHAACARLYGFIQRYFPQILLVGIVRASCVVYKSGGLTLMGQQIRNALVLGAIYALVAIGYTMVYGIIELINFAHGDVFTLSGFYALIIGDSVRRRRRQPGHRQAASGSCSRWSSSSPLTMAGRRAHRHGHRARRLPAAARRARGWPR